MLRDDWMSMQVLLPFKIWTILIALVKLIWNVGYIIACRCIYTRIISQPPFDHHKTKWVHDTKVQHINPSYIYFFLKIKKRILSGCWDIIRASKQTLPTNNHSLEINVIKLKFPIIIRGPVIN